MNKDKGVIILLVMLVLFSVLSWMQKSAINELKVEIEHLSNDFNTLQNSLLGQVNRIRGDINLSNNVPWWNIENIALDRVEDGKVYVRIEWQLNEYKANSEVTFNYQSSRDEDFNNTPATQIASGYYRAVIPVTLPFEPVITFNHNQLPAQNDTKTMVVTQQPDRLAINVIKFYISVREQNDIRNTKISSLDMSKMCNALFKPLTFSYSIQENQLVVNIQELDNIKPYYEVSQIYLENRNNSEAYERWMFENMNFKDTKSVDTGVNIYRKRIKSLENYQDLYLIIKYTHGLIVEKKLALDV